VDRRIASSPLPAFLFALVAPLAAQQDAASLASQVEKDVTTALLARADALSQNAQHGRATEIRRLVLQEWSPGDERALPPLGFVKVGETWKRDANKAVIEVDQKGDSKTQKKIDQEWAKTEKDLVKQLEAVAKSLAAAGDADRAVRFHKRVLWFRPNDKNALAAIAGASFEGFTGTPMELAMLRRGRSLKQAVEFLLAWEPPMEPIAEPEPVMQAAGVPCIGVATPHFRIHGAVAPERLRLAAASAERALLLARLMFANQGGERFEPKKRYDILWTSDRAAYKKVLDACRSQFTPDRLRFLQEDCDYAFVQSGDKHLRLYTVANGTGDDFVQDVTARGVAQDAAGIDIEGLYEGIGHATVAILFDRTLSFFLEQPQGNTVTSWKPKPLLPDMETWRVIAAESAWAKNDTPTARLVLVQGSKLTNEERVKAWSMCDYLVRTSPTTLFDLAAVKTPDVREPDAVAAAFAKKTGKPVAALDEAWRAHWGTGHALRKAMLQPPQGKKETVADSRALAHAIWRARAAADCAPGGFVVAESPATQSVHDHYTAVEKHELQLKQMKASPKGANATPPAPPVPPAAIGTAVAVHEGLDADAAVRAWMGDPALRDYLLDPGRAMFAVAKGKRASILETFETVAPLQKGPPMCWPRDGQRAVPSAQGAGGTPITLHFFRDVEDAQLQRIACIVRVGGQQVPGTLQVLQGPSGRGARGCVAFVPSAPLPAGEGEVEWSVPVPLLGGKDVAQPRARFVVQ